MLELRDCGLPGNQPPSLALGGQTVVAFMPAAPAGVAGRLLGVC
jgi:hypothetical protein